MDNIDYIIQGESCDFKLQTIAEIQHLDMGKNKRGFGQILVRLEQAVWCAPLNVKIMVYGLQSGDMMLMMSEAIHAPMTPLPCSLFKITRP